MLAELTRVDEVLKRALHALDAATKPMRIAVETAARQNAELVSKVSTATEAMRPTFALAKAASKWTSAGSAASPSAPTASI